MIFLKSDSNLIVREREFAVPLPLDEFLVTGSVGGIGGVPSVPVLRIRLIFLDRLSEYHFPEAFKCEGPAFRRRDKSDCLHKGGDLTDIGPCKTLEMLGSRDKLNSIKKDFSNQV